MKHGNITHHSTLNYEKKCLIMMVEGNVLKAKHKLADVENEPGDRVAIIMQKLQRLYMYI